MFNSTINSYTIYSPTDVTFRRRRKKQVRTNPSKIVGSLKQEIKEKKKKKYRSSRAHIHLDSTSVHAFKALVMMKVYNNE